MNAQVIPAEAVEAAMCAWLERSKAPGSWSLEEEVRAALEAAAPHMLAEAELMRWKLDALKEWADAMIDESYYPQYGRDVKTILEVPSMDEAREISTNAD